MGRRHHVSLPAGPAAALACDGRKPDLRVPVRSGRPGREALGATHGAELPYVFGIANPRWVIADHDISEAMQTYWANFAATGDPNGAARHPSLPVWPKFLATRQSYMEFADPVRPRMKD